MKPAIERYAELFLFYGSLLLSIVFIFTSYANPSLDGPAHVYNAKVINYLLSGNKFLAGYFSINKVPVPNLLDHAIMALLDFIFPALLSQKILLAICVVGFSLSFRGILKLVNPANIGLSAFAIPLSQSYMYYLGFYNFCLSSVLLLWGIYYYIKHFSATGSAYSTGKVMVMMLLLLLNYFANALSFLFIGFTLSLYELWLLVPLAKASWLANKRIITKRLLLFSLLWIPGLIFSIFFSSGISFMQQQSGSQPLKELLHSLVIARPLEVFGDFETSLTSLFSISIVFLLITSAGYAIKKGAGLNITRNTVFLIVTIFSLLCYLFVPNNSAVGMMTIRLCFYFFLFLSLWLVMKDNFTLPKWIVIIVVYSFYWVLFFTKHQPIQKGLDERCKEIVSAADKYIGANSVVLPVNCTGNWIMPHMGDYMGIDKPEVNMVDYEPRLNWFPIVTNTAEIPYISLGYENTSQGSTWINGYNSAKHRQIDYVFIFGDFSQVMQQPDLANIKESLKEWCTPVYISDDQWIHIYKNNCKGL